MNFNLGLTFSGVVYTLLIIIIYFKNTLQVRDMEENLWKVEFI